MTLNKKIQILGFEEVIVDGNVIYFDGEPRTAICGKHSVYVPDPGMKIINTYNGKIDCRYDWDKGRNFQEIQGGTFNDESDWYDPVSLMSIVSEVLLLRELGQLGFVPEVGADLFFIKNYVTRCPYGEYHSDPKGRFGYYMKNAKDLPRGNYVPEEAFELPGLELSEAAKGDWMKEDNLINGYLIDVRRTLWDMPSYWPDGADQYLPMFDRVRETKANIIKTVKELGQFPFRQRKKPYQKYYLTGHWVDGTRRTLYRFDQMGIEKDLGNKTLVDLGCCYGAMATEAYLRGARKITGFDNQKEYIDCARMIARKNGHWINYLHRDFENQNVETEIWNYYGKEAVDIVFALSLYKHIHGRLFTLLDGFDWKVAYIESNNAPDGFDSVSCQNIEHGIMTMETAVDEIERLGMTEDRSPRCLWRITSL